MLGLFLLLPVLALYARELPDYSPALLGLTMGAYGLAQVLLQIPFGRWSDRRGRKPLITIGLIVYAAGSLVGALAHTLAALLAARAVQGAGAVSAPVMALLADLTRSQVRTRAMAFIGISIGFSFVAALVLAPALESVIGVRGIFVVMLAMAVIGISLLHWAVPGEPPRSAASETSRHGNVLAVLRQPALRPMYFGVFVLHFLMTATFLAVPQVLVSHLGIAQDHHWAVYLGVFVASLAGTVPLILGTERGHFDRPAFVLSVVLLAASQAALATDPLDRWWVLGALAVFFAAFNYLEARLPALLTTSASASDRGAALGMFATCQFLGAFGGGAIGGLLLGRYGLSGVFWGSAALAAAWVLGSIRGSAPPGRSA
jgi:predicted MFS family arabinose efflux permease